MSARLIHQPTPFHSTRTATRVKAWRSVSETLAEAGIDGAVAVTLNGRPIPEDERGQLVPSGALLTAVPRPAGGLDIAGAAAIIASLSAAEIALSIAATAAAVYGLNKVRRSLVQPSPDDPEERGAGRRTSIVGEANGLPLYEPLMQVLGKHRVRPNYGALPYSSVEGGKLYGYYLFDLGKGFQELTDLRIGEDPLLKDATSVVYNGVMDADGPAFDKIQLEIRPGSATDDPITIYDSRVEQTPVERKVRKGKPLTRETPDNVTSFSIIVSFNALIQITSSGKYKQATVRLKPEYRKVGDVTWISVGNMVCTARTRGSKHFEKQIATDVEAGKYEIRLTRNTANATDPGVLDESIWSAIVSTNNGDPILEPNTARVAIKAKLTNQLPDGIDDFSLTAFSRMLDWTGSAWVEQVSSNPASVFRHVLQGPANLRPVDDARLDLPQLEKWHAECTVLGWEYNSVIGNRGRRTVFQVLQEVCAAGRASFTMVDGKFSVVLENDLSGLPVQMFTPHNSWDFRAEKQWTIDPDGLNVGFVDPDQDWLETDRQVLRDGFTTATAEDFDRINMPGVTNPTQAWRLGRYNLAVMENRDTHYSVRVDWESMNVTRGDYVTLRHDAILAGEDSGRIASVQLDGSSDATGVTLDEPVEMDGVSTYGIVIRTPSDTIQRAVVTQSGETNVLVFQTVIPAAQVPSTGDLFAFGLTTQETIDCVVYQVRPGDEYGAELVLLDAAATEVLAHETELVPAYTATVTADETAPPDPPDVDEVVTDVNPPPPIVEDEPPSTSPPIIPRPVPPDTGLTINPPGTKKGKKKKRKRRRRRRGR